MGIESELRDLKRKVDQAHQIKRKKLEDRREMERHVSITSSKRCGTMRERRCLMPPLCPTLTSCEETPRMLQVSVILSTVWLAN